MQHSERSSSKSAYARIWRWHFYAGLYVAPFMLMLASTGLVVLSKGALDEWLYADRLFVPNAGPARLTLHQQLDAVSRAFPQRMLTQVTPAFEPTRATEVLTAAGGVNAAVYVDPTSGVVLGEVLDSRRPGVVALTVHGTLLAGRVGDWLIEIAAGLGVVLIVSGLYLWWPAGDLRRAFQVARGPRRLMMRDLHRLTGVGVAPVFVFYLITGLTWTEVWGERFSQAWSTFPAERSSPDGTTTAGADAALTHGDVLNSPGRQVAPWALEQTSVPVSVPARQHEGHAAPPDQGRYPAGRVTADAAIAIAQARGIGDRFVVRCTRRRYRCVDDQRDRHVGPDRRPA